jgi:hypothetical protein
VQRGIARRFLALLAGCALIALSLRTRAEDAAVPIALQVELLSRLLWYERGLQRRPEPQLRALILERPRDPLSGRSAAQVAAQLDRVKLLGGKSVSHTRVVYQSLEQIARVAEQERPYLAWITPGFGDVSGELARSLGARGVLSVSSSGPDAVRGVVLGFELASGKPRIMLNLQQARAQKLDFNAQFLRVVRVVP